VTAVMDGRSCPFALCLVAERHTHPACPDCGAVRYGNACCDTCRQLRAGDPNPLNPHTIVTEGEPR
jgi:hypothetical protein